MPFPHLFSPIQLGNIELPNRIVHVPTDISSSHADGEVSERDIHHHTDVARGGTGFVIVGATTPDMKTGLPTVTCLVADGDNYIPGLARLAEGMHRYGAKCAVQLQHPGRQCAIPRYNTLGATDRVLKLPWSAGHEIIYENAEEKGKEIRAASIPEILELVDLFSEAAWRVKQAGFDAVELHAAHGYLLSEFMSPFLNMRTDRFGGSFENRMRFPLAVIDSIQKKCGKGFPVLVRYSFEEWCPGGRDMEEGIETARVLERAGVAAVDLSQGMQESPGAGFDPMQYPQGWATYAAEAVKKAVKIPVITSHSLRDPEYCEQILAEGKTDLVGLARQILADPYWPVKAQYGKVKSIRRCISCLGGCWQESLMAKKEIACSINAACGNPAYAAMKRTSKPVRVAVVGGGPAGMEAARIATERGHQVTLFEKHAELGGAMLYVCLVPGKEKMRWYLDWIRDQLLDLDVDIRLGHAPTVEELRGFDVVLNATGAVSFVPPVAGDASRVVPFEEAMACPKIACECHPGGRKMRKLGARVLLWGDSYAATDTAAFLVFFISALSGEDLLKNHSSIKDLDRIQGEISAELNGGIERRIKQLGEAPAKNPYKKFYCAELAKEVHEVAYLTEKQKIMFDTYSVRDFEEKSRRLVAYSESADAQGLLGELDIVKRELKNSVNLIESRKEKLIRQRTAYLILFFILWITVYFYYGRGFIRS